VTDIVLRAVRVNGRFEPVEFGDGPPRNLRTGRPYTRAIRTSQLGPEIPTVGADLDGMTWRALVPAEDLARALRAVLPACSTDPSRPVLQTVEIWALWSGGPVHVTATDSYRIHHAEIRSLIGAGSGSVLLPRYLAEIASRWIPGRVIRIGNTEDDVILHYGEWGISAPLVEGIFPDWRKFEPPMQGYVHATISEVPMRDALSSVTGPVTALRAREGYLEIRSLAYRHDRGKADAIDPAWYIFGSEPWQTVGRVPVDGIWTVNTHYLRDLWLGFSGRLILPFDGGPTLKPIYAQDGLGWGVLMPVRVTEAMRAVIVNDR
jgi:hypothetical protein